MTDLLKQLEMCSVATIHEVIGQKNVPDCSIRPLDRNRKIAGIVKTVKCKSGDNLTIIRAVHELQEDEVLVIDCGEYVNAGPFGEVLARECMQKKCRGLITNGSIRDTQQIIDMGFPVYSRGISVIGTTKLHHGEIGTTIVFGGVVVHAGDYVLADGDGVVFISRQEVEQAIRLANERDQKEKIVMQRIQNGESLYDIYGYEKVWVR